jgi:dTMP kinase
VSRVNRAAAGDFWPDLTIVLDLAVAEGLARAQKRSDVEDRYERMGTAFHARIRDAFLEIANAEPDRCAVIEAEGTVDHIAGKVWDTVQTRLSI